MRKIILTILIICLIGFASTASADTSVKDFFKYNYTKGWMYLNTLINNILIGQTTTTTDTAILQVTGGVHMDKGTSSDSFHANEFCINTSTPDCISSWPTGAVGNWATDTEQYFWNNTTTWAGFESNWQDQYNATTTLNGFTDNSVDWDTAYGWGDHSSAGYSTHATDTLQYFLNNTSTNVTENDFDGLADTWELTQLRRWATDTEQYFWNNTTTLDLDSFEVGNATTTGSHYVEDLTVGTVASTTRLQVGGTASASFRGQGDIFATSGIKALEGLYSEACAYGAGLEVLSNGGGVISTNAMYGDATLTAVTQIITDTNATFGTPTSTYEGGFLKVIGSTPDFTCATGEIKQVLNNEQLVVSFATAGDDTIVDATGMSYVIYEHPVAFNGDNGTHSYDVGVNEDAKFEIHIDEGNGFHGFLIDAKAGADQFQGMTLNMDGNNKDGIVLFNLYQFSSEPVSGKNAEMISLEVDGTGVSTSTTHYISMDLIGQSTQSTTTALSLNPNITHIIEMGTSAAIDKAWYWDSGGATSSDVTTAFTTTGTDTPLWETNGDAVYTCNSATFNTINFAFDTTAQQNLGFTYHYWDGNSWEILNTTDTLNGGKISGNISWTSPQDWVAGTTDMNGEEFEATARVCMAIVRTNGTSTRDPIEDLVTIVGDATTFALDADYMQLNPVAEPPYGCDAGHAGGRYNDTDGTMYYCDGTSGWQTVGGLSGMYYAGASLMGLLGGLGGRKLGELAKKKT